MRGVTVIAAAAVGALCGFALLSPASAMATPRPSTRDGQSTQQSTHDNALAAMHGEAYAHATYLAYAQQAARTQRPRLAALFVATAHDERYDHFAAEARLIHFGRTNVDNLRDAIAGEIYEATVMYPTFARQAARDGCEPAADLFTEISADEAHHARLFRTALYALTHPGSGTVIPIGEAVPPQPVLAGPPRCTGETLTNLTTALRGEAFANAKYTWYAETARRAGIPRLARLFAHAAGQELGEHFAEEATLAGLVRDNATNLRDAIAGEWYEARTMYPRFAREACAAGDHRAARLFREIGRDEAAHAAAFTRALRGSRHIIQRSAWR